MAQEAYFKIDHTGTVSRVQIDRKDMLPEFYRALDCNSLENVRTVLRDVCLIVDECGKIKAPVKPVNEYASCFYMGAINGLDYICGDVIIAAIHLVDGDPDWVPLTSVELAMVIGYLFGVGYPEQAQELKRLNGEAT